MTQVVIAGAGPTGLMLAGELALAGVDIAVVERRQTQELAGQRAGGLHARTLEVLDQRGIVERFVSQGQVVRVMPYTLMPLDLGGVPTRHDYVLALSQGHIERILAEWVAELGVRIVRGVDVVGFAQDDAGVDVALSDGRSLRAQYVVGCDGGRSTIRKQAEIDFRGWDASTSFVIAEVEMTEEPPWGLRRDARGQHGLAKLESGRVRVLLQEPQIGGDDPTLQELRDGLVAVYGKDFGARNPTTISRFTDAARQAVSYRSRRVLLAGDAAHVHSPAGGQGLNTGVQDAVNLGWKLAQVVQGTSPDSLLDTYQSERHPVGARVLRLTMAITALQRTDDRTDALREVLSGLVPRMRYAALIAALDIHYDLGAGHPLLGRRMPDLDLGDQRVYSLLHAARPLLLSFGERLDARGRQITARYSGPWALPVLGDVPAPSAVLIRPDGHVAWVGDGTDQGLSEALRAWC